MSSPDDAGWRRLDDRTVLASAAVALGVCLAGGVPTLAGMRSADSVSFTVAAVCVLGGSVVLVLLAGVLEWVRLERTRFRVGSQRVEVHTGIVVRTRKGLARERVRTVEVTADPVLRVLGLATVRIGTGQHASAGEKPLELRALRRHDAEALRGELLARRAPDGTPADGEGTSAPPDEVLAVLDPGWVRFAPLSVLTPTVGIAAFGALLQASDWVGLRGTVLGEVVVLARALGLLVTVVVALVAVGVVGSVGSLVVFTESWWRFRLTRERSTGSLHVRRGLLTTRSTTIEEERLRGVAVVEPPGARFLGAARVDAIATGLSHADQERSDPRGLLPVAPLAVAERVVADALGERSSPTAQVALRAHPRAARGRRIRWATAVCLVPAVALAIPGTLVGSTVLWGVEGVVAVLGVAAGYRLGVLAYRNLGHGLVGDHVVTRHGAPGRRTVVLRRDGILTWAVTQSPFQRRAGLATLWFTTAAGDGRYGVYDVAAQEATTLAVETLGDRVTPFLAGVS
ncbi:PH domain-containing protein [Actinomycetospora sp.]|uniref:PH domain-containing protein n=1 Tax=Actinomycetospora sp. TaxID=1872135 RepID=UPI002F3E955C